MTGLRQSCDREKDDAEPDRQQCTHRHRNGHRDAAIGSLTDDQHRRDSGQDDDHQQNRPGPGDKCREQGDEPECHRGRASMAHPEPDHHHRGAQGDHIAHPRWNLDQSATTEWSERQRCDRKPEAKPLGTQANADLGWRP